MVMGCFRSTRSIAQRHCWMGEPYCFWCMNKIFPFRTPCVVEGISQEYAEFYFEGVCFDTLLVWCTIHLGESAVFSFRLSWFCFELLLHKLASDSGIVARVFRLLPTNQYLFASGWAIGEIFVPQKKRILYLIAVQVCRHNQRSRRSYPRIVCWRQL